MMRTPLDSFRGTRRTILDDAQDNLAWGDLDKLEAQCLPVMSETFYWLLVELNFERLWFSPEVGVGFLDLRS